MVQKTKSNVPIQQIHHHRQKNPPIPLHHRHPPNTGNRTPRMATDRTSHRQLQKPPTTNCPILGKRILGTPEIHHANDPNPRIRTRISPLKTYRRPHQKHSQTL